jgi:hypothetical protein
MLKLAKTAIADGACQYAQIHSSILLLHIKDQHSWMLPKPCAGGMHGNLKASKYNDNDNDNALS